MKRRFTIIGILFTMVLLCQIPLTSLSQTTSTSSDSSKNYCFNEIQYRGILRLYTMYEEGQEMMQEYEHRLELKDSAYSICSESLFKTNNQLQKTNNQYKEELEKNLWLDSELKRIKRQRNYIVVGGVCITGILTMILFAL